MTNVLEEILNDKQGWKVNESPKLNAAVAAYEQFNAAFDNFAGTLIDLYPDKEQDEASDKLFKHWYELDGDIEKMLVCFIAAQASGREGAL